MQLHVEHEPVRRHARPAADRVALRDRVEARVHLHHAEALGVEREPVLRGQSLRVPLLHEAGIGPARCADENLSGHRPTVAGRAWPRAAGPRPGARPQLFFARAREGRGLAPRGSSSYVPCSCARRWSAKPWPARSSQSCAPCPTASWRPCGLPAALASGRGLLRAAAARDRGRDLLLQPLEILEDRLARAPQTLACILELLVDVLEEPTTSPCSSHRADP